MHALKPYLSSSASCRALSPLSLRPALSERKNIASSLRLVSSSLVEASRCVVSEFSRRNRSSSACDWAHECASMRN